MNHKSIWGLLLLLILLILALAAPATTANTTSAAEWQPLTGPYGGSVAALAISPGYTTDLTTFAGLRGQGVYRAYSDTTGWQSISPPWHVVDLALSPDYVNDKTVFALSGLSTTGYTVHRSADRGDTWQTASPAIFTGALGLAISPNFANDQTLYLYASSGVPSYISTDGGVTFTPLGGWWATHGVNALAFSPDFANDQILFALVPFEGLYQSIDSGANWTLTSLTGSCTALAVSPNFTTDQTIIATDTSGQLHRSNNSGTTWTTPPLMLAAGGQHTLRFSPTFASDQVILAASSADPGPYRSEDGGLTWSQAGWYDPAQSYRDGMIGGGVFDLALAPTQDWSGTVYAATSIGVARSAYSGNGWIQRNKGLAPLTVRSITAAPGSPNIMLAGTSYHENMRFDTGTPGEYDGSLQLSKDGGHNWKAVSGRLDRVQAVAFSPDFANDATAFAAAGMIGQHGYADGGVYRSTNGGENWDEVLGNLAASTLAVSPNFANDQTVWTAVSNYTTHLGIYRSQDGGTTWNPLASGINAQSIIPSPNFAVDQTLFAGTPSSGLQKSTNSGAAWTPLATPAMITALAVSPAYGASQTLIIGAQASVSDPGAIYHSADGGATWTELITGIPTSQNGHNLTIADLSFAVDGSILAGVHYGGADGAVYRSVDGGDTWTTAATNLTDTQPYDLLTRPSGSFTIFAGVEGGLRQLEIAQGTPAEPGTWDSSGPRGGAAQTLAVSPDFANDHVAFSGNWRTTFQGSESGSGFVKSNDGGQTWAVRPDSSESPYNGTAVHAYALSPIFPSDGTGFAATGGGVYKTTDGGENWHWLGGPDRPSGFLGPIAVAPDFPSSGHVMTGASTYGDQLYLSQDGGLTWTMDTTTSASAAIAYSPNFASDQTAFTAGGGVFKTIDAGLTWTEALTGPVRSLAVSPNFAADGTLFAGGWGDFYRSDNGGSSWITRTIAAEVKFIDALAVSPQFASDQTLFAGTEAGLFWSADGGDSWQAVSAYAGTAVLSLAISPDWPADPTLLVGTYTGVYRLLSSNPAAGTVRQATEGFEPLNTIPLALANDEALLLTGTTFYGIHGSQDNGQNWQPRGFEGNSYHAFADLAISPNYPNDQTFFAARTSMLSIGGSIYRTTNGGGSWDFVYGTDFVSGLAISPQFASDQTVFAATNSEAMQISTDGGDTWSALGSWPVYTSGMALQVALPPNYPADGTVFAAGGKGFWRLPAGATMWETAVSGLTDRHYVTAVAVSPAYASDQTLLVTASWSDPVTYENYASPFLSTDGGVNWIGTNAGLPNTALSDVTFSPHFASDHTAYVTTRNGQLYRSRDGGVSWTLVGSAPGQPTFYDVQANQQGTVFVSTSQGVWQYTTPALDILINGRFEAAGGWEMPATAYPARYTEDVVYDGQRAVQIGLVNDGNRLAYSSARQTVTLPVNTITAALSFQIYPVSGETTAVSQAQLFPETVGPNQPAAAAVGDAQYGLILDPDSGQVLDTIFWELRDDHSWQARRFDLSGYAGRTIVLHFGVHNDGLGGRTAVYLDNAALVIEQTGIWANNLFLPIVIK